ncbi:unnamed protein product, partial [Choristocarpus tenellus]
MQYGNNGGPRLSSQNAPLGGLAHMGGLSQEQVPWQVPALWQRGQAPPGTWQHVGPGYGQLQVTSPRWQVHPMENALAQGVVQNDGQGQRQRLYQEQSKEQSQAQEQGLERGQMT